MVLISLREQWLCYRCKASGRVFLHEPATNRWLKQKMRADKDGSRWPWKLWGWLSVIVRLLGLQLEPICREFVALHPPLSAAPIQAEIFLPEDCCHNNTLRHTPEPPTPTARLTLSSSPAFLHLAAFLLPQKSAGISVAAGWTQSRLKHI